MDRWIGRVALVTGASAGIGAEIVKQLVQKGMKVIGVARRVDKVRGLQAELKGASGTLYPIYGDVSREEDILAVFEWATKTLGGVDVLINNAGLGSQNAHLTHSDADIWRRIFELNVLGLSICTREAIKSMQARGVNDGHIIHISSLLGHQVVDISGLGMYTASKFAVTALTEALRKELIALNSRIKITSICPGVVKTDFGKGDAPASTEHLDNVARFGGLEAKDVADSVVYALATPENVMVSQLHLVAVRQKT